MNKFLIIVFLDITVLISCKKKDDICPEISITSPYDNQVFNVYDEIIIDANVSDNKSIDIIDVNLTDMNNKPVMPTNSYYPHTSYFNLKTTYILDDIYLETGNYYLHIRASDGVNSKNKYIKLYVYSSPKYLKYLAVITNKQSYLGILKVDSLNNVSNLFNTYSDYSGSAVSSRYQQLYIAGKIYNNIVVYSLKNFSTNWQVQSQPSPPSPYFNGIDLISNVLYVAYWNNKFESFNYSGASQKLQSTGNNWVPYKFYLHPNYIVLGEMMIPVTQEINKIALYYSGSYSLAQELTTDYSIVGYHYKDNDNFYVLGNKNGQGVFYIYNITANGTWSPLNIPSGKIYSSCSVDENHFMFSKTNEVMWYQYQVNSLTTFKSGLDAKHVKYEPVSNLIYISEDNKISWYTYPFGVLVNSINISDSIYDFHFVYNK